MKTILILATLDTKFTESEILKGYIEEEGCRVLVLDCSLRAREDKNTLRKEMLQRAGMSEEALNEMSKNQALCAMTKMVEQELKAMYRKAQIDGALGIGGVQGTLISAGALQKLPFGFPKLVLSAVANGNTTFGPLVGMSDMMIMHSVVDVAGSNRILKHVMQNAASAICGMVRKKEQIETDSRLIGMTMGGVTTKCGNYIQEMLSRLGYEVVIFHCNGIGAMAMEKLAEEGKLCGVIDLTPHDVMDYLAGGMMPASAERYEAMKRTEIPTLIIPGCADLILFNGIENVPKKYRGRKLVEHNKIHTHVKANYEEMYALGKLIVKNANEFLGPTEILIPEKGYSQKNKEGAPLFEPESDRGFVRAVNTYRDGRVFVRSVPMHINDEAFAAVCVEEITGLLEREERKYGTV